jgi:hypothetical protein
MRHLEFSRIADEEAAFASQADGVEYFLRTAPADGGLRASITIHMLHPESGESVPLFRPPQDPADMPVLIGMTEVDARELLQDSLSVAREIRKLELDDNWKRFP